MSLSSDGLRESTAKGVVWTAVQSWGDSGIKFLVFLLLARLLGPEPFGLVALAGVFVVAGRIFQNFGFTTAVVQREALEPKHLDTAFWTNLGLGFSFCMGGIVLAGPIAAAFEEPSLAPVVRWLSLTFLLGGLSSLQEAILRRRFAFKALAIRTLIAAVAGGIVGIILAFRGLGVWSLVAQSITQQAVGILVLWAASDWRPRLSFSGRHFRDLFGFGVNIVGIGILEFFDRQSDRLLIGYFLGTVALGFYSVAQRILDITMGTSVAVTSNVSLSTFSRLQDTPDRLRRAFYKASQMTSLIALPVFLGMSAIAPELVNVLLGTKWEVAADVLRILALLGLLYSVFYFQSTVITAMGKPSWNLRLKVLHTAVNVILFFVLVRWGIVAVAAGFVARAYVLAPIRLWLVNKLIHLDAKEYMSLYRVPFLASLAMLIALFVTKHLLAPEVEPALLVPILIAVSATIYVSALLLIAPNLCREVQGLFQLALTRRARS